MATVMVGQGLREYARIALQDAKVPVTREGYTDSSTTAWGFVVRTRKTIAQLQKIVFATGIQWCDVTKKNLPEIGRL